MIGDRRMDGREARWVDTGESVDHARLRMLHVPPRQDHPVAMTACGPHPGTRRHRQNRPGTATRIIDGRHVHAAGIMTVGAIGPRPAHPDSLARSALDDHQHIALPHIEKLPDLPALGSEGNAIEGEPVGVRLHVVHRAYQPPIRRARGRAGYEIEPLRILMAFKKRGGPVGPHGTDLITVLPAVLDENDGIEGTGPVHGGKVLVAVRVPSHGMRFARRRRAVPANRQIDHRQVDDGVMRQRPRIASGGLRRLGVGRSAHVPHGLLRRIEILHQNMP